MESAVIYCNTAHIEKATLLTEELGLNVIKVFKKSHIISPTDQIWEIINHVKENYIDKVMVDVCRTISPNITEFISLINLLIENDISLVILDHDLEAVCKGEINHQFKMILDVLSEFDLIYQQKLKRKMKKAHIGFQAYLDAGGKVGRRTKRIIDYMEEYSEQIRLLRMGVSLKQCRKLTSTSIGTLRKLKRLFA